MANKKISELTNINNPNLSAITPVVVNNITLGRGSGNVSTNIAFGNGALLNVIAGSNNIGIGQNSLNFLDSGTHNIGIGVNSVSTGTTASRNIGIGFGSLAASMEPTISL